MNREAMGRRLLGGVIWVQNVGPLFPSQFLIGPEGPEGTVGEVGFTVSDSPAPGRVSVLAFTVEALSRDSRLSGQLLLNPFQGIRRGLAPFGHSSGMGFPRFLPVLFGRDVFTHGLPL